MDLRSLILEIIKHLLVEKEHTDDNMWVSEKGRLIGPFNHGHSGYILKVAIPKKEIKLSQDDIDVIEGHKESVKQNHEYLEPVFDKGWARLRAFKNRDEIDAHYNTNISAQAKKTLIDTIFKLMQKNTKRIFINNDEYTIEEFFERF